MTWERPLLLVLAPAAAALVTWLDGVRLARLRALFRALGGKPPERWVRGRTLLVAGAVCCVAAALSGPRMSSQEPTQETGQVDPRHAQASVGGSGIGTPFVILMDASRSMGAEDVTPDRTSVARNVAVRLATTPGVGPVGVVAFAARGHLLVPPTSDPGLVTLHLEGLDPGALTEQGTDLAKGLEVAMDALAGAGAGDRRPAVVVVSDGEGFQEEDELRAALSRAISEGITVHAIVVGTEEGAPVPGAAPGGQSRARPGVLDTIARATGGRSASADDVGSLNALAGALATPGADARGALAAQGASPSPITALIALGAALLLLGEAALGTPRQRSSR